MEILLLSLCLQGFFDNVYSSLIDDLSKNCRLKRCQSKSSAIRYLEANNPDVILITDQALTDAENRAVLDKVLAYVQNGGLVIVGWHFPNFTNTDEFDAFWAAFSLPWKRGDYHRTDFQFNPSSTLPTLALSASMPNPYSMKALHVRDARSHEKIFVPTPEAQTQSFVFAPGYVDQTQAVVVGAKVGQGYLAYHGDVNGEKGSDRVILSLCGL